MTRSVEQHKSFTNNQWFKTQQRTWLQTLYRKACKTGWDSLHAIQNKCERSDFDTQFASIPWTKCFGLKRCDSVYPCPYWAKTVFLFSSILQYVGRSKCFKIVRIFDRQLYTVNSVFCFAFQFCFVFFLSEIWIFFFILNMIWLEILTSPSSSLALGMRLVHLGVCSADGPVRWCID